MQVRTVAAAPRRDAVGKHRDHLVEFAPRQVAKRIRTPHQRVQVVLLPILGGTGGDNLLRQYVQRRFGNYNAIEFSKTNRAHERRAFDQFVARGREQTAFRDGASPMSSAAHALQAHGDRAWRTNLANEIHCADINSQFKRCRCHQRANLAGLQFAFHR